MTVISVLLMHHFEMGEWLQLKKAGKHVRKIGAPLSDLWEWSLGYMMPRTSSKFGASQALQLVYAWSAMVKKKSFSWHSLWCALGCWHDNRFSL